MIYQMVVHCIFNDREWTITYTVSRACHYSTLTISEIVQDRDRVTME